MSEIKRFDHVSYGMVSDPNGEYIFHSDHEAEIARLRDELADAHAAIESKAGWEWKREADRLRAEAEKYRVDAERYRWLRDCSAWSDAKNPCPYSKSEDGQLRCITAGLDAAIDAAMGEGK